MAKWVFVSVGSGIDSSITVSSITVSSSQADCILDSSCSAILFLLVSFWAKLLLTDINQLRRTLKITENIVIMISVIMIAMFMMIVIVTIMVVIYTIMLIISD